ncbi:hypothetical protein KUTeg_021233 [Tegillarca granosa]|uniref:G-protein coupled receptors family 1 profile domain-containing protein n=1 Tax=Tegillarca granosa TaxID=220873 RepID=A0ABQ9EEH8_TEGGR|nr:hypothetical protein KUTeg_021233 [Tegillarca granosa]
MSLLCDGVNHCPNGEDEIDCVGLQCPGSLKCHSYEKQSICIPINSVCDGIRDCPLGDDERLCNVTCPNGCLCSDLDFTCNRVVNLAELDLRVNRLDFSHQFWPWDGRVFRSLLFLGELVLKDTSLTEVFRGMFENLINLYFLDLRDNAIKTIQSHAFKGLKYLQILLLKGNPLLQTISESSFDGLSSLVSLDLSRKNINDFPNDAFKGLVALKFLNLSYNKIHEFNTDISKGLDRLEILDIRQSGIPPKASMFDSLTSLETLYTDFYVFCCLKPPGVSRNRCFPPEDEFSSCKYLMKYSVLRVFIWIIGMAALLGNILVIIVRVIIDRSNIVKRSFPIWVIASGSILQLGSRQKKEAAVARSLFMVVLTDFLCWFPVGIMADVYVWVTVFVIPINSALNPFLYTFSSILKRKRYACWVSTLYLTFQSFTQIY